MRVLIVEHEVGDAAEYERRLHAAGHETVSCADPAHRVACRGLDPDETCPLDDGVIDAALVVPGPHHHPGDPPFAEPAPGYVCACRQCIPTVAVGGAAAPANLTVAAWVAADQDVVETVERCATEPLPRHSAAATTAVRETLDRRGLPRTEIDVRVERREGRLHIHVDTDEALPAAVSRAASVRALAAVRHLDPLAPSIGVTIEP